MSAAVRWVVFAWDMAVLALIVVSLPITLPLLVVSVLLFPRKFPMLRDGAVFYDGTRAK